MHESNLLTDTVHSNPQLSHALFSCLIHSFFYSFNCQQRLSSPHIAWYYCSRFTPPLPL